MAAKKTFEFFFGSLLKKFFQDMGRDPNNLEMIILKQKAGQLLKDSNKVINFPQKRSFAEEIELMKKSGDLVDKDNIIISDKITDRDMFNNSFLNKPTIEGQMEKITGASNKIKEIQKEIDEMYRPKTDAEITAKYDKQNKESIQKFKDKMKKDKPEDKATGGRAGFYTGGITDVEPSLDDIGHGADAMMARTRLMSPGSQTTTSTGLNYLLAEDNDNMRIPFSAGGDAGRRAFLKLLAALTGGAAAVKSGIIGLGEGVTKKGVSETVKKAAGSGQPPPYFFELIETIKKNGTPIKSYGERVKQTIAPSKDGKSELMLTEDLNTGDVQIKKIFKENDEMVTKTEEMNFNAGRADEVTKKKPADDYEEVTSFNSRIYKDNYNDPDFEDGINVEEIIKEIDVKKADGGRIGFRVGGSGKKFIEKIFGKGSLDAMKGRDPEMYQGMLEVVDMFRKRDKEGLKIYMQKFLPHMDDETVEAFIRGDAEDAAGLGKYGLDNIQGQLIRLSSGRDYAGKIEALNRLERNRALKNLDVTDNMKRKPNASGGLQTMLGE
jgi:hypothetical protein